MKLFLSLFSLLFLAVACQQNKSSNNTPVVTPQVITNNGQYGYNNGVCFDYTRNIQVDALYCNTVNNQNNGYSWNGSNCIMTSTGQLVDPSYCNYNYNNGSYLNNSFNSGRWVNGQCVNTAGQIINQTYCSGQTYAGQCQGVYYQTLNNNSYFQFYKTYNCWGANCSGKTLIDISGRQVTCL